MRFREMTLTENEIRTVYAVFSELGKMKYGDLNTFLGSITIKEMRQLFYKIYYADYCERYGIKYENMTDEDRENAALEDARAKGYAV
jgi:hypothetical protein